MKYLKQLVVGFVISFVGSIPLGYLNFIGFEIYNKSNLKQLVYYLLGVVIIEGIIIYATFYFAYKLILNSKIKKYISIFSILFLLILAYHFYPKENQFTYNIKFENEYAKQSTFLIGFILSSLNFAQIPFWLSWNLYLVNNNYISTQKKLGYIYVLGTVLGTFFGMLFLILVLKKMTIQGLVSENFISESIWILFLSLAIFQVIQYFKKK